MRPHVLFNVGRVVGFAVFGALIGLLGSALQLSTTANGVLTVIIALFMIVLGLQLMGLIPAGLVQPPKRLSHWVHDLAERGHAWVPAVLGAATFFLPCGFTQSMQLFAMSTGSPVQGALTMTVFALGTLPALLGIGYVGPSFWLDRRIKRRQVAIRHALPDALDLLVVCTEAGLGLDAGLQRVTRDMDVSHPEMMDELTIVIAEIRAGVDRMEALRNLGKRTGLDDIQALVMTLAQSMRFGTSIAESLRYYSEELRTKRMQAAREQAAKLTVKMALPLGICFMPGFLIITAGAAILSLVVAMKSMG